VAVVGPGDGAPAEDVAAAREAGRLLASAGAVVVTGGLGGVMVGATEGARAAGGVTVALLPGDSRDGTSATVAIPTGLGEARNVLVVRAADAVLAVGGSWGTMSEIALARRTGVPVVCLGGWRVCDAAGVDLALPRASSAIEAVGLVVDLLGRASGTMGG
jgi:uncharacterized protein (TIGR00725 family)